MATYGCNKREKRKTPFELQVHCTTREQGPASQCNDARMKVLVSCRQNDAMQQYSGRGIGRGKHFSRNSNLLVLHGTTVVNDSHANHACGGDPATIPNLCPKTSGARSSKGG